MTNKSRNGSISSKLILLVCFKLIYRLNIKFDASIFDSENVSK